MIANRGRGSLAGFLLAMIAAQAAAQGSPSAYTTAMRYDALERLTGTIAPDPDGAGPLHYAAVRNTYDSVGRLIEVETGELSTWQSQNVAPGLWGTTQDPEGGTFIVFKTVDIFYDTTNRKTRETVKGSNGALASVTDYSYDALGRSLCTAIRMNPAAWATVTDACTAQAAGSNGPDRIAKNVYDAANQQLQVRKGVGTSVEAAEATYSYTPNGRKEYVIDADGNRARLVYDGLDRQTQWIFPSPTRASNYNDSSQSTALATANSLNNGDYEQYGYDANGNRTSLRKRDATTIGYSYDALNRMTHKSGSAVANVDYGYDIAGHQTSAAFSAGGQGITNIYNGCGDLISTTSNMGGTSRTLSYQYDADGDRTGITHPDGANFTYGYDGMGRLSGLYEGSGTTAPLMTALFRADGLLSSRSETGGSSVSYGYDNVSRLNSQSDAFTGGSGNLTRTLGYNAASQITTDTRSNNGYAWTGSANVSRGYSTNGLNQYTAAGATNFTYDANGNLTGDGTWAYTYDGENRLIRAIGAGKDVTLGYDPLGRLYFVGGTNVSDVTFVYDGDALIGEYSSTGAMTNRYVHGSNAAADDPLVWYIGSGVSSSNRRYLHANHQGSIIAQSDASGANIAINTYDEYGIPGSTNTGRFGYTGQAILYEIGLDYYKARIYSPTLGRFLQTDPIGYEGGENLYAYVGDDPVDGTDPSGNQPCILPDSGGKLLDSTKMSSCWADFQKDKAAAKAIFGETQGLTAGKDPKDESRTNPQSEKQLESAREAIGKISERNSDVYSRDGSKATNPLEKVQWDRAVAAAKDRDKAAIPGNARFFYIRNRDRERYAPLTRRAFGTAQYAGTFGVKAPFRSAGGGDVGKGNNIVVDIYTDPNWKP
ncbi:MAG: RHS repeat-associated core domain-containing protein [Sphingomonas sp.]